MNYCSNTYTAIGHCLGTRRDSRYCFSILYHYILLKEYNDFAQTDKLRDKLHSQKPDSNPKISDSKRKFGSQIPNSLAFVGCGRQWPV